MSLRNIVMGKVVKFFVLALCIGFVVCDDDEETTTDATTESATIIAIAEEVVDDAVNIDVGRYTTLTFEYFNNQLLKADNEDYNDTCIDEYIKCTVSLTAQTPICAFNDPYDRYTGYLTTLSYCDIYFDNCRREIRVWRIMDSGICKFYYYNSQDDVHNTYRRKHNPLIHKLLRILSKQSGKTAISISKLPTGKRESKKENWIYLEGTPIYDLRKRKHFYDNDLRQYLTTVSGNSKISTKYYNVVLPEHTSEPTYWRKKKAEPWFNTHQTG